MSPTTVYKVTIQATPATADAWKVVASGTWTPGQQPQLEQILSAEVVEALFNVSPSENSGRKQVQLGEMLYAMVSEEFQSSPLLDSGSGVIAWR